MPYNPGVVDRSGELLGAGIQSIGSTFGNVLAKLAEKQEEEKFMVGAKKLFRPKDDAQAQKFGYNSVAAYDNADARQVMGGVHSMIARDAVQRNELERQGMTQQLAALAQERQGTAQFNAAVAGEPQDTAPMTGDPVMNPNSSSMDIMAGLAGQTQGINGQLGNPNSSAAGIMSALSRPAQSAPISIERLQQLAAQANLPIRSQDMIMQMAERGALAQKARAGAPAVSPVYDEDPVTGARMYRLGKQAIPTGMNPAMNSTLNQAVDSVTGEPIPGMFIDARGRVTRNAGLNPAGQEKLSAEAQAKHLGTMAEINNQIGAWKYADEAYKKDPKGRVAPDPAELKYLQQLKAHGQQLLMGGGAGVGASERGSVGAATVSTKADYQKLPSGAMFIGPDGKTYRKK